MADPLTPAEARRRFDQVTRGRHVAPPELTLAGAKARLREVDAGLDIGPALRWAGRGRWGAAAVSLLPWLVSPSGRAYLAPLVLRAAGAMYLAIGFLRGLRKPGARTPRSPAAGSKAPPSR